MKARNNILNKFRENKGFLCTDFLEGSQHRYQINNMLKTGEIYRIRKGVYILKGQEYYDERVLAARMYPKGVFCLFTAWDYYGFTTTIPSVHYLSLTRNTKVIKTTYPPVQINYWGSPTFETGINKVEIDGCVVQMYDKEKSVCDAVKFRGKVGEDIAIEVVKSYLKTPNRDLEKLMRYAAHLRVSNNLSQIVKPLL